MSFDKDKVGFIPPDYSDAIEKTADDILDAPTDDDIDEDIADNNGDDDDKLIKADPISEQQKINEKIMATPFLTPTPAPSFGGGSGSPTSPVWGNKSGSSFWETESKSLLGDQALPLIGEEQL